MNKKYRLAGLEFLKNNSVLKTTLKFNSYTPQNNPKRQVKGKNRYI